MLENKVIVYDDSCPMCRLYTYWFVAWGFLKPENRVGFANAPPQIISHVDLDRGRHEIPLVDRKSHDTIYGLSALTFVLESKWSWLAPIFKSRVFWWIFYPLYQIITYNRRVIAGCKACDGFDCAPDINRFYRSVYLGLAGSLVACIAILLLLSGTLFAATGFAVIAGFTCVGMMVGAIKRACNGSLSAWNYLGNQFTTLAIVAMALLPVLLFPAQEAVVSCSIVMFALILGLEEVHRRAPS